ncbi:MAG TPA: hypothetical protein VMA83_00820 [Solirubrobacteraceae bacterium]|nr:hypothetical protein [Solirubrobacteraceae bacterium]
MRRNRNAKRTTTAGRSRAGAATLAALAIGLAGCGGSSSPPRTAASAPTRSQFLAKANAICAKGDPALSAATFRLATVHGAQRAALVRTRYVPMIEAQISAIRSLGAPAAERAAVAQMLSVVQADLARLDRHPDLDAVDVFADFARVAHPFGLTACAPLS